MNQDEVIVRPSVNAPEHTDHIHHCSKWIPLDHWITTWFSHWTLLFDDLWYTLVSTGMVGGAVAPVSGNVHVMHQNHVSFANLLGYSLKPCRYLSACLVNLNIEHHPESLTSLLGEYHVATPTITSLCTRANTRKILSFAATPGVLCGFLFVCFSETSSQPILKGPHCLTQKRNPRKMRVYLPVLL